MSKALSSQTRFRAHNPRHRLEALLDFLDRAKPKQAIIFCNSRRNAEKLYDHLKKINRPATEIIHGGLEQGKRTSLFNRFRWKVRIIVADHH